MLSVNGSLLHVADVLTLKHPSRNRVGWWGFNSYFSHWGCVDVRRSRLALERKRQERRKAERTNIRCRGPKLFPADFVTPSKCARSEPSARSVPAHPVGHWQHTSSLRASAERRSAAAAAASKKSTTRHKEKTRAGQGGLQFPLHPSPSDSKLCLRAPNCWTCVSLVFFFYGSAQFSVAFLSNPENAEHRDYIVHSYTCSHVGLSKP